MDRDLDVVPLGARRPTVVPPPAPVLYGVQGFSISNYYQSANPGGIAGSASGFWVALLCRVDQQIAPGSRALIARFNTIGWQLTTTLSNGQFSFQATDGGGTTRNSLSYTIQPADLGKVMHVSGVHDGSTIRLYVNGVGVGAATACVGFTPLADRTYIGRRAVGLPNSNGIFFGACGGHAVVTAAEVTAHANACKAAADIVPIAGKTNSLWSVKQDQAGAAPPVLDDKSAGAQDMDLVGALTLVSVTSPVWGW